MIIGLIIAVVVIAVIVIGMYNSFIKLKNNCEEAFSTMDVYLKKRYDLIPNLVEIVKVPKNGQDRIYGSKKHGSGCRHNGRKACRRKHACR